MPWVSGAGGGGSRGGQKKRIKTSIHELNSKQRF